MTGVSASVYTLGDGTRECRGCGMKFSKFDAIGPYPTHHGEPKGLVYDHGQLRHVCEQKKARST